MMIIPLMPTFLKTIKICKVVRSFFNHGSHLSQALSQKVKKELYINKIIRMEITINFNILDNRSGSAGYTVRG